MLRGCQSSDPFARESVFLYYKPMFLDEAIIEATGGAGGRGCVGWRREKYVPHGGPDGGDGGRGGDILLKADENTDTLSMFASRKRFEAEKGGFGRGSNKNGKVGEALILAVPPGTTVLTVAPDGSTTLLADLRLHGENVVVAQGGRGGFGNAHFVSSTRQKPDFAELGEPGEHVFLKLELKLVADVGIIGFPSVGKSTLISVISAARPKIAAYPFTTLIPNLGVVNVHDRSYVVCDVPGLIEGASEGKGLGDKFLKHVERCGVLLHVLDISRALEEGGVVNAEKLLADYHAIRHELVAFAPHLEHKRELVLLNKADLIGEAITEVEQSLTERGVPIFLSISAATRLNTDLLTEKLLPIILEERQKRERDTEEEQEKIDASLPVLRPQTTSNKMGSFRITQREDGAVVITGKRLEQFTRMTDFQAAGAVQRFRDVVDRIGLRKALNPYRKVEDVHIYIADMRIDEYL